MPLLTSDRFRYCEVRSTFLPIPLHHPTTTTIAATSWCRKAQQYLEQKNVTKGVRRCIKGRRRPTTYRFGDQQDHLSARESLKSLNRVRVRPFGLTNVE